MTYVTYCLAHTVTYWKEEGHDKRSLTLKDRTRSAMDVNASTILTKTLHSTILEAQSVLLIQYTNQVIHS